MITASEWEKYWDFLVAKNRYGITPDTVIRDSMASPVCLARYRKLIGCATTDDRYVLYFYHYADLILSRPCSPLLDLLKRRGIEYREDPSTTGGTLFFLNTG